MSHKPRKDEFKVGISILHKMVLYATLLIFIAVGVSTYLAVKMESKALTQGLIHTGRHMARDIASSTESAFWSLNWVFVEKMLRESGQCSTSEVIYAKIVKPNGEVYLANDKAHYGEKVDAALLSDRKILVDNYRFPEAKVYGYLLVHPVKIGNDRWYVMLGLSLESVNVAIRGLITRNLGFGGLIILLGIIGSFLLSRSISRPIISLAGVAKGISSGHWNGVDIKSKDEIGLLGDSFNRMVNNLRQAEETLRVKDSAMASSINGIALADLEGNLTYVNRSFLRLWGYDHETEILGKPAIEFWQLEDKAVEVVEALRDREGWSGELIAKRKDGTPFDVQLSASMATDEGGKPLCMMASLVDITTRVRAERALRDRTEALERTLHSLRKAVEESSAEVTHDPLPTVMADDVQLGQLFQNLLGNALKFRGKEPPHIHVSAQQKGDEWLFSVRDNGIGIDPDFSERIFTIFQRLHKTGDYPGTGIGLAICNKIVERHGGRIWVESKPEKGSTFYFTIPAGEGDSHEQ